MIYDVSWPITPGMTRWPGTPAPSRELLYSIAGGDEVDFSCWTIAAHAGTHIDAPSHFLSAGATADRFNLESVLGPCWLTHVAALDSPLISADYLQAAVPRGTKRLLIRTKNSEAAPDAPFDDDYMALSKDAAEWIVENGIICVGIDALSVERPESPGVHESLLGANVAVIEGLRLAEVPPGMYELLCLPLPLVGSDGAPARVVLASPS